ncbi:hypothetical protein LCGC14_1669340 [marine sediment metagenome]|uniref:Prohead serine protease domain-containing protein n=1 Tax=marine sediment metagenome TaxID=412755 RepID=A0A0F9HRS2_9ZZZZ
MDDKFERRFLVSSELRVVTTDGASVIEGYAAVFNSLSEDLGGFREIVMPGAFTRAIDEKQDVRALVNHDPSRVMARTKNDTLELEEDSIGLKFRMKLNETQFSEDMLAQIKRRDVDQVSFGFRVVKDVYVQKEDDTMVRELHDVDIFDVSPTAFPAYPATSVEARNRVLELRNAGEPTPSPEGSKEAEAISQSQESVEDSAEPNTLKLRQAQLELSFRG